MDEVIGIGKIDDHAVIAISHELRAGILIGSLGHNPPFVVLSVSGPTIADSDDRTVEVVLTTEHAAELAMQLAGTARALQSHIARHAAEEAGR